MNISKNSREWIYLRTLENISKNSREWIYLRTLENEYI
jgi:hypothetical protein